MADRRKSIFFRQEAVLADVFADWVEDQQMCHRFQRANVALDAFAVDTIEVEGERVQINLRSRKLLGLCPDCNRQSKRVQSRYPR
jgi:hypothetical protein